MTDQVSQERRSEIMSKIRAKNTKPELWIRKGLHRLGFRFRLHDKNLPEKPDLILHKYRAVIFVQGCFWHGHDNCSRFRLPRSNIDYWQKKIEGNRARDRKSYTSLREQGWRILYIWECSLKGKFKKPLEQVLDETAAWLNNGRETMEIRGEPD